MNLADALFSGTQQRVLGLIFGDPARSFYANEVIARTRGGSGAVQRELARLAETELVTVTTSGNRRLYRANPGSPIFKELCGVVQKTMGLAEPLRTALLPLADRIQAAFLYGSVAKREDRAGSDIDLIVVSEDLGYADLYGVLDKVGRRLGREVNSNVFTRQALGKRIARGGAFVKRVLEQPKIWLIGGVDALGI
jgi:predicted nucleotidyltransferase